MALTVVNHGNISNATLQRVVSKAYTRNEMFANTVQTFQREAASEAKREMKGQTDKDTAKVIQSTAVTADVVKSSAFVPFARAQVTQASVRFEQASSALTRESYTKMIDAGYKITPSVTYRGEIPQGASAGTITRQHGVIDDLTRRYSQRADGFEMSSFNGKAITVFDPKHATEISRIITQYQLSEQLKNHGDLIEVRKAQTRLQKPVEWSDHVYNWRQGVIASVRKEKESKLPKDLKELRDSAENLAKTEQSLKMMPKRFMVSAFRASTMVMRNTDTMRGGDLLSASYRGAKGVERFVVRPVSNIAYNMGAGVYNKMVLANASKRLGLKNAYSLTKSAKVARAAYETKAIALANKNTILKPVEKVAFKDLLSTNPLTKLPAKAVTRLNHKVAREMFKGTANETAKAFVAYTEKATLKAHGKISAVELKTARKELTKTASRAAGEAVKNTKPAKAVAKAGKAVAKTVEKVVPKPLRDIAKYTGKGIGKAVSAPFKLLRIVQNGIGKALAAMKQAIASFVKFITPYMVGLIQFIFGVIIVMYLISFLAYAIDMLFGVFIMSDAENYAKHAKGIYKVIEECHEEQIEEIEDKIDEYDAGDVEYINGANENYKEVWCVVSVMLQEDLNNFDIGFFSGTNDEFKCLVKEAYRLTHRMTFRPYKFKEPDGAEKKAVHVYLNILRDEGIAYESLSLYPRIEEEYEETPEITVDTGDWLETVRGVKLAYSKINPEIKERVSTSITVNGMSKWVRYDQSGFVSACLRFYGSISDDYSIYKLLTSTYIPGFTRFNFSSFESLKEGDIIVSDRGCAVFLYTVGNIHYLLDGSRAGAMYSGPITEDYVREYAIVWRPNDPGSITTPLEYEGEEDYEIITHVPQYTNEPEREESAMPSDYVTDTNEEGALIALKVTLQNLIDDNDIFTASNYSQDVSRTNGMSGEDVIVDKACVYGADHVLHEDLSNNHISSIDFVRYVFAQHGVKVPFDDAKALCDMGDMVASGKNLGAVSDPEKELQTGDIVWYLTTGGLEDWYITWAEEYDVDIWKITPSEQIRETEAMGEYMPIGAECLRHAAPLIYVGDGQLVGYVPNLLDTEVFYSDGCIRTYNLSDLEFDKIWYCHRVNGFTVKPIYGANMFFEGWTNKNITELLELMYDPCWETGSCNLQDRGDVVDDAIDWGWYSEGNFVNSSHNWQYGFTKDHYKRWKEDLCVILIKNYEDYGMLPSTSFSVAYALSGGRTSEEALLYYNVYEMLADDDEDDETATRIHHTEYDEEGNATATYYNYRKYSGYKDAWLDWFASYKDTNAYKNVYRGSTRRSISAETWATHDQMHYSTQLAGLLGGGVIEADTYAAAGAVVEADKSSKVIESDDSRSSGGGTKLVNYDKYAMRRREAIENIDFLAVSLVEDGKRILNCDSDPSVGLYNDYIENIELLMGEVKRLESIDNKFGIETTRSRAAKEKGNKAIGDCKDLIQEIYDKHREYLKTQIPDRCAQVLDEETGEYVSGCVDDNGDGYCDSCTHAMNEDEWTALDYILDSIEDSAWIKPQFIIWITTYWDGHDWLNTYTKYR